MTKSWLVSLVFAPLALAACDGGSTTTLPKSPAADKSDDPGATGDGPSATSDPSSDPGAASAGAATTSADGGTAPAKPNSTDGEGEPAPGDLAVDTVHGIDCAGPFDCVLPNPAPADRNRIVDPKNGTEQWPLAPNTPIVDGIGGSRGTVTAKSTMINYGQRKTIKGASYVYAFSVGTDSGTESSWVPESAVLDPLTAMPSVLARDPGKGDYDEVFTITGGDPTKYGDAKVISKFSGSNGAATDYLTRPGNVVNALWALPGNGGVSNDTYPVKAGLTFKRAKGVASVYVYLYTKGTDTVIGTERFVYGSVNGRYSWIARDALDPPSPSPGPSLTFCCAKCAGRTAAHRVPDANDCASSAESYCAAGGTRGAYESSNIGTCDP